MKKAHFNSCFLFLFFLPDLFYSQADSLNDSIDQKARITGLYCSGGLYFSRLITNGINPHSNPASNSSFFNNANYQVNSLDPGNSWTNSSNNPVYSVNETPFSLQAGIFVKFKTNELKKHSAPYLKIGLNYFSNSSIFILGNSRGFVKSSYNQYNLGGSSITRDSVKKRDLLLSYSYQNLNVEADFLLSTYQQNFIVFYCGIGGFAGPNFNGTSKISYTTLDSVSDYNTQGTQVYYHYIKTSQQETLKNKAGFTFGAIVNLGLEFAVYKAFKVLVEYRLIYRSQIIRNYGQTGTDMFQFNLGIRYSPPPK